ncbi:MAG: 3-dehydroquinate synthase [Gemmatimonadota bacterium]
MRTVVVELPRPYPVLIGEAASAALIERLEALHPKVSPSAWALVSDARVEALHGRRLRRSLAAWGAPAATVLLPEREAAKTWEVAGEAVRRLAQADLDRDALVVALGGGSVGDVAGFAAGVFLRGVDLVNVPTTFLACVDASVGGKTGVNLPEAKNLAGVFHQPRAVVVDLAFLATLPESGWRDGWAETVKIAITSDPRLFELLERAGPARDTDLVREVVERACRAKARIVALDEREDGARKVLNFGHTVGHAIEAAGGFVRWSHGEAVALGISCALELGVRLGVTAPAMAERCRGLLRRCGLPVEGSGFAPEDLHPFLARDKKREAGRTVVLLTVDLGRPILRALPPGDADLDAAIRAIA